MLSLVGNHRDFFFVEFIPFWYIISNIYHINKVFLVSSIYVDVSFGQTIRRHLKPKNYIYIYTHTHTRTHMYVCVLNLRDLTNCTGHYNLYDALEYKHPKI